jgi:ketosteroid isomerase-like protein
VARTCPGLPFAGGRVTRGPEETVARIWGAIHRRFDVLPEPDEYLETSAGTVVGVGIYRGTARSTGRSFQAWFAHVWRISDGRVTGFQQITDTAQWTAALETADGEQDRSVPGPHSGSQSTSTA